MGIIIGSSVGGFLWTAGGPAAVLLMASAAGVAGALICLGFVKDRAVRNEIKAV